MKTLGAVKYLFAGLGAALLAGAAYWRAHTLWFIEGAAVARGTVVDLRISTSNNSRSYYPIVEFVAANGAKVQYVSSSGSNPPSYARGEPVKVYYNPSNPQDALLEGFFSLWGGPLIVGGMGAVFLLIGGSMILLTGSGARRLAKLRASGRPVVAKLQGVEQNTSFSVNGAHPWRIVSQWQDPETAEIYVFRSENLWFDPTDHLAGEQVTVFIEPGNPKRYAVDLSFLPKLAG